MDETSLKPNSHVYKEEEKRKIEKVVSGKVEIRKRSRARKFLDLFLAEDIGDVKSYLLYDILIPTIKETAVKMITNTTEMLAYGRVRSNPQRTTSSYISYDSYSKPKPQLIAHQKMSSAFDDIIIESRGEAELLLDSLRELIDMYGQATVRDFLDAVGISGSGYTNYTQENYGWKDLRDAYVARVREGYLLVLPRVIQLD